ncbi:MAG: hypothetical protein UX35_C0003G0088 [Microgenomates group bacterium GW2011_GWA1_46_15]|nr:MAG: hypothetical protein UX00_C0004G0050 [Microgenomates group bacterium GW2011_GWB1_45_17]KKU23952.1 MAG: hypothetical protein UX35_C0003G0088 [Microgenomates group bacterium GW2011_GWA1_46_15]KKU24655.1 MAG: hypothetical protein UX36_C0001G0272 [Microgenomates group bacterium GW2011_GWC1_46_15]
MICYDGCMTPTEVPQASLSNVAFIARNAIKYGAFLLAFFIIGRVILNMSFSLYRLLNPPKPPEPTYGFGTLPSLTFPQSPFQIKTYTLQTKDGSLPMLANQLPVYFIPVGRASLFSSDNAKQVAGDLGFEFPPEQVSETVYRWKRTTPLTSTLEMDIVSQNFTMRTDWSTDPNFLTNNRKLPTQSEVANRARGILRDASLLPDDMATGEARITLLKSSGSSYTPAVSFSEADFVQVDLFRTALGLRYPVFRPDPSKGSARMIFSGSEEKDLSVVEMEFMHFSVEYDRAETYGLVSTLEAWKQLQAGKGYVAYVDQNVTSAVVRNVALAYYDSDTPQNYLQPIYVFTGDNNFFAYVPAVAQQSSTGKK